MIVHELHFLKREILDSTAFLVERLHREFRSLISIYYLRVVRANEVEVPWVFPSNCLRADFRHLAPVHSDRLRWVVEMAVIYPAILCYLGAAVGAYADWSHSFGLSYAASALRTRDIPYKIFPVTSAHI